MPYALSPCSHATLLFAPQPWHHLRGIPALCGMPCSANVAKRANAGAAFEKCLSCFPAASIALLLFICLLISYSLHLFSISFIDLQHMKILLAIKHGNSGRNKQAISFFECLSVKGRTGKSGQIVRAGG